MPATTWPRTMSTVALRQRELTDRHAGTADWDVLAIYQADPQTPSGPDNYQAIAMCTADVDTGATGSLRLRSSNGQTSTEVPVTAFARNIRLGATLLADGEQLIYIEGKRTTGTGTGGLRLIDAAVSIVSIPPGSLLDGSATYASTRDLVATELAAQGKVLAWMDCTPSATNTPANKRSDGWEAAQTSAASTNADGSPSYGFWFPNTEAVSPSPTDYSFESSTAASFSGAGYAYMALTTTPAKSLACQMWRLRDQAGTDLPHTAYFSWRVKFGQTITYQHTDGSTFGFTNMFQIYRKAPSNLPFITLGAGRDLTTDSAMRWHINLDNRFDFDLAQITTPTIPIGSWIHMEVFCTISDGADGRLGRLGVWQDGVQLLDHSGPTIADYWESYGVSWGIYGHLLQQTFLEILYDECLISTAPTHNRLTLPSPTGGLG